ncbi:isochorismatase family protein [Pseudomonas sp. NPDC089534]|uniref:isochorismatase family protein n=1 Tax=Pseudomonas sp. NPDC089534 TaxID=3364468 RepID=UPI00382DE40A
MTPKLKANEAVLVLGDLQIGITDLPLTVPQQSLVRSAAGLARLAEIFDIPTLALCIPKGEDTHPTIIPEITRVRSKFQQIRRTCPDSFESPAFRDALEATGRKSMIVCGVATEIVVQWLALSGIAHGYRVFLVVDACGGLSQRTEEASLRRLEAAGVVMTSVVSLAGEISGDFTTSPGREAIGVVFQLIATGYGH